MIRKTSLRTLCAFSRHRHQTRAKSPLTSPLTRRAATLHFATHCDTRRLSPITYLSPFPLFVVDPFAVSVTHLSSFAAHLYSVIVSQTAPRPRSTQRTKTKTTWRERKSKTEKKATPIGNSPCLQVAFLLTLVCFYSQVLDTTTMSRLFRPVFVRPFDHNNPPSKRRLPPCSDTPIFRDAVCLLFASVFGVDTFQEQHFPTILAACPPRFSFSPTPSRLNQVVGRSVILYPQRPRFLLMQRGYSCQAPGKKETPTLRISNKECWALMTPLFCILVVGHHL